MKIIHISDLHFGTQRPNVVKTLLSSIEDIGADLIIVSGDLTQRALREEFVEARAFLDALNVPFLSVPGNHDIPAYNVFSRFFTPYKQYQEHISDDLCPVFQNNEALIVGVNTARRAVPHWNWANGAISTAQCKEIERVFTENPPAHWNICVMHHPLCFDVAKSPLKVAVFGRDKALKTLAKTGVDIVLTGHTHHAGINLQQSGVVPGDKILHVGASTALSSRVREQNNGFNLIELAGQDLRILTFSHDDNEFRVVDSFEITK